jgi:hypothetical protein
MVTLLVVMLLHNNNKLVDSCYVVTLIESMQFHVI